MKLLVLLALFFTNSLLASQPKKMIVIVNDEQKTQLKGVTNVTHYLNQHNAVFDIFSLDDVDTFESSFSAGLPADEEKARELVKKKYDDIGQAELQKMVLKAYTAKILTLKYKLEKYPAVIFDDSYVVYGEFNLNIALNTYLELETKL